LKSAHAKEWTLLFVTVAFVGTDELILEAGADAERAVITQVVPPYYLPDLKTMAVVSLLAVEVHAQFQTEFRQPGRVR
jgi:hypothetical protein